MERRLGGRLGRRLVEAAPASRRQVRFTNGGFSISKPISASQPRGFELSNPPRQWPDPFIFPSLHPSTSAVPKPFTSFADLFKHQTPSSAKRILPLPSSDLALGSDWTTVINKKRLRRSRAPQQISVPHTPKRCFFCGDLGHMARYCNLGTFKCFRCNKVGHTSRSCPTLVPPQSACLHPAVVPIIQTPDSIIDKICKLSSFGILSLGVGSPSMEELREMLEYRFNIKQWKFQIIKSDPSSFLVQFPSFELLQQAVLAGYIDMGSFGGTFCKWTETKGMQVHPKHELYWIKLSGIPLHLWDGEFLSRLLKDYGELYASSHSVMFMEDISACKVLLKTRCKMDIPNAIPYRYISPINGWLLEGKASIEVLGNPISEEALSTKKGSEFLINEGEPSLKFSWKDLNHLWDAMESEVQRPLSSDDPPPSVDEQPASVDKGKKVIDSFSNVAGNEGVVKVSNLVAQSKDFQLGNSSLNPVYTDMVEIMVEGKSLFLPRTTWASFYEGIKRGSSVGPSSSIDPTKKSSIPKSSFRHSPDAISSTAQPPGFERPPRLRRCRIAPISLLHKPYHRFMAGASKPPINRKGQSSSTSTPFMPINSLSEESLVNLASNCGIKNPMTKDSLDKLKELEIERALSASQ